MFITISILSIHHLNILSFFFKVEKLDITAPMNEIRNAFSRLEETLKSPISIYIFNAGVTHPFDILVGDDACYEHHLKCIEVNLLGTIKCTNVAVGSLKRSNRAGHIVCIGSLAAKRGYPGGAGYCASKSGLQS